MGLSALWMPKPDVREPRRVTELAIVQEHDTHDVYAVIEDTQDRQTQLFQRVNRLVEDGQFHYEAARLLDQEALFHEPPEVELKELPPSAYAFLEWRTTSCLSLLLKSWRLRKNALHKGTEVPQASSRLETFCLSAGIKTEFCTHKILMRRGSMHQRMPMRGDCSWVLPSPRICFFKVIESKDAGNLAAGSSVQIGKTRLPGIVKTLCFLSFNSEFHHLLSAMLGIGFGSCVVLSSLGKKGIDQVVSEKSLIGEEWTVSLMKDFAHATNVFGIKGWFPERLRHIPLG
ncbi:hypothetical protein Tco_0223606 [Tanacetum coccineum]